MGRLIDADELIEALKEDYDDADIQKTLEFFGIYDFIENQPTAFNVDKVVEQLNDRIQYLDGRSKICMDAGNLGRSNRCSERMCELIKAREIVEKGGIDG